MLFVTWIKIHFDMGPHGKDREYPRDRANIGNPKVNRHCPPLAASRISADCAENTLGPPIQYIPLPVCHTGDIYAICWGADQSKHQTSASLVLMRGMQRVSYAKNVSFNDVIMHILSWLCVVIFCWLLHINSREAEICFHFYRSFYDMCN